MQSLFSAVHSLMPPSALLHLLYFPLALRLVLSTGSPPLPAMPQLPLALPTFFTSICANQILLVRFAERERERFVERERRSMWDAVSNAVILAKAAAVWGGDIAASLQ